MDDCAGFVNRREVPHVSSNLTRCSKKNTALGDLRTVRESSANLGGYEKGNKYLGIAQPKERLTWDQEVASLNLAT